MRRQQCRKRTLRWCGKKSLGWIPCKASGVKVVADTVRYVGHAFRFCNSHPLPRPITTIDTPRWYRRTQKKVPEQQRKRRSRRVRNLHAKIANWRKDFLHQASHRLTQDCELIVIGNIRSSALAKTNWAKSVNDAGWAMFKHFLEYKARVRKVAFREVSERLTTQTCSQCGALGGTKGRKGLGIREWMCSECGTIHHRDVNATLNILRLGHQLLALK